MKVAIAFIILQLEIRYFLNTLILKIMNVFLQHYRLILIFFVVIIISSPYSLIKAQTPSVSLQDGSWIGHGPYVDGQKNDFWQYYDQENVVRKQGSYDKGTQTGLWEFFDEQGIKEYQIDFDEGLFIAFYADGIVSEKGGWIRGDKTGKWVYFFENGERKSEGNYQENSRVGEWFFYTPEGMKSERQNYDTNEYTAWYPNGNIQEEGKDRKSVV